MNPCLLTIQTELDLRYTVRTSSEFDFNTLLPEHIFYTWFLFMLRRNVSLQIVMKASASNIIFQPPWLSSVFNPFGLQIVFHSRFYHSSSIHSWNNFACNYYLLSSTGNPIKSIGRVKLMAMIELEFTQFYELWSNGVKHRANSQTVNGLHPKDGPLKAMKPYQSFRPPVSDLYQACLFSPLPRIEIVWGLIQLILGAFSPRLTLVVKRQNQILQLTSSAYF